MTMKKEIEALARRAKKAGLDPETVAPTTSALLRKIFFLEWDRYVPRNPKGA